MQKMILKNIFSLTALLILAFALISCKSSRGVVEEKPIVSEETNSEQSEFDPLSLAKDSEITAKVNPKSGSITGQNVIISNDAQIIDSVIANVVGIPDDIDSLNSQAYRVQILSTKVYSEARQALKVAEEIFDRPISVDYEVPYFKVRVGKFSQRDKAEDYKQRVKAAGYNNAWVVMVTVNIQETAPLYDESNLPETTDESDDENDG